MFAPLRRAPSRAAAAAAVSRSERSDALGPPHLERLHGLRGLLAITVVAFHLSLQIGALPPSSPVYWVNRLLRSGPVVVPAFLVLSGFLLSLPVVTGGTLSGGMAGFLRRRAQRLLLPYFAALVLTVVGGWVLTQILIAMGKTPGPQLGALIAPAVSWSALLPHLLLYSNAAEPAASVFWTISCEVQIMVLFACLLVPLWRSRGLVAMVAASLALGAIGTLAMARGVYYYLPWMLPCFTLGSVAAAVTVGTSPWAVRARQWPWGAMAAVTALVTVGVSRAIYAQVTLPDHFALPRYFATPIHLRWIPDLLDAVTAAAGCVWLVADVRRGGLGRALGAFLASKWMLRLGLAGYSLYLTHTLSAYATARAAWFLEGSPVVHWLVVVGVGTATSVMLAALFWRYCERPSMPMTTRRKFADDPGAFARPTAGPGWTATAGTTSPDAGRPDLAA